VNQQNIERLRNPGFEIARRGYDMREVDTFLLRLADWLESEAVDEIGTYAVQRKLELVGKTTTHILQTTEDEAEAMRQEAAEAARNTREQATEAATAARTQADAYANVTRKKADDYSDEARKKADAYSDGVRRKADAYSEEVRKKADDYAAQTSAEAKEVGRSAVEAATAKANQLVAKGEQRRAAIEAVIADLRAGRDEVLDDLERLSAAVSGTVRDHRVAADSASRERRKPRAAAEQQNARP
jgi:DivIVA domain-containing protein